MAKPLFPDLVVNGETVPAALVAAEAQHHQAPKGKPGVAWRKAAEAIAIRTLLLQEARRLGLEARPDEIGPGQFETKEAALIGQLLDSAVEVNPPDEATIRAEWERVPERFCTPPLWEVSHILCACNPEDRNLCEATHTRAAGLTRDLLDNPKSFARLASRHSDCSSAASGGALGQLGPGMTVPEFEAALRLLREGEITPEPVMTRYGWHIIRMEASAGGDPLPFETVRPKIAEALEKRAWAEAAKAFVNKLVAAAEISGISLSASGSGSASQAQAASGR